jgi:prepilin-type N-terminal cleavage/methylation domain-containing protein
MQADRGYSLVELMVLVAVIGILVIVAIPNYLHMRQKANDASAKSAGKNIQVALEVYYNKDTDAFGSYTDDLGELMRIDRNLMDDPGVTFVFQHASTSGYSLYTLHHDGTGRTFQYHD